VDNRLLEARRRQNSTNAVCRTHNEKTSPRDSGVAVILREGMMAIEYGAFIVDGLDVRKQTLTLAGVNVGFTDAEGFASVQETLVRALTRVGAQGWTLVMGYPNNTNQTEVLIFSRPQ
jgi:hypothetical protein